MAWRIVGTTRDFGMMTGVGAVFARGFRDDGVGRIIFLFVNSILGIYVIR